MAFEELDIVTKHNVTRTAKLSYMRHVRKDKNGEPDRRKLETAKPKLVIYVPTAIFISHAKAFRILLGSGPDAGKLRIQAGKPDDKNAAKPKDQKNCVRLDFGYVPRLGDECWDGVESEITKVTDDVYDLTVPAAVLAGENKTEPRRGAA